MEQRNVRVTDTVIVVKQMTIFGDLFCSWSTSYCFFFVSVAFIAGGGGTADFGWLVLGFGRAAGAVPAAGFFFAADDGQQTHKMLRSTLRTTTIPTDP